MDEPIGAFCNSIASFCNHLQTSCDALKQSIGRRPIPLDSASSTFVQCLNRRVSTAGTDLNLLESMSFGTVSFEELLGHCNEVYKKNQSDLAELEDCLRSFGYISEPDFDDVEDEECHGSIMVDEFKLKTVNTDPLLDDSFDLQDLGLSDACLATIASDANCMIDSPPVQTDFSERNQIGNNAHHETSSQLLETIEDEMGDESQPVQALKWVIEASKDDYDALPSYMKTLATWEDLLAAVGKINQLLSKKEKSSSENLFHQDELAPLELGHKGRSYILLLLRMNRLAVDTVGGSISYRVL